MLLGEQFLSLYFLFWKKSAPISTKWDEPHGYMAFQKGYLNFLLHYLTVKDP
jgi:hypothetical protein